jgi:cell division protease FtsH
VQSKRVLNDHEKRVVAFHEAGHALCAELLPAVDRVHKISIVPRGRALGFTLNLPAEDRYLKTREELIDYMTMLLGGRVAEQVVFGAITTGASDDLRRVTEIGTAMIDEYAMGTASTAQRTGSEGIQVSDLTLRIREEERQELADQARRKAVELIEGHREQLDALAAELLENEVLDRPAIDRIMAATPGAGAVPGTGLRVAAASAHKDAPSPGRTHEAPSA